MPELRAAIILALGLAVAGCGGSYDRTPPQAYLDWRDRWIALTGLPMFGHSQICELWTGKIWDRLPVERCVRMTPPRHWQGVWISGWEEGRFCPGASNACPKQNFWHQIWLSPRVPFTKGGKQDQYGAFRIDFIGRRTLYPGWYGMGMAEHEVVVDRLISIERLPDRAAISK